MAHPKIVELENQLNRELNPEEALAALAKIYLEERDALQEKLFCVLGHSQTYFNDCPCCGQETLWQAYDGDDSIQPGAYCLECGHDLAQEGKQ